MAGFSPPEQCRLLFQSSAALKYFFFNSFFGTTMLIICVTQILSILPKQRMGLYRFLNTHFPFLKYLCEGLEAPAHVCFSRFLLQEFLDGLKMRWFLPPLRVRNTELPWKTRHSGRDCAPGSHQPPASPPDPVIQRIYIHKYFKAEQGRSQSGYAGWISAKGRDLFPSQGRRGCGASGPVLCPGILSQLPAQLNGAEQNPWPSPATSCSSSS